ncbi:MAG: glycoside hydrolase family 3 N-terminal domain-containing protein, partial [Aestuariivirgaceae bacterium]
AAHQIYGQLVMVGFTGLKASDDGVKEALRDIEEGYAGGLVFFGRNISDAEQIRKLTGLLKSDAVLYAPLLAIDEEGGQVERLTPQNGFRRQPSAAAIAARGPAAAREIYAQMAGEIADAGFNFNLGPVVDLNLHRTNPVIGSLERSYSSDPQTVVEYAQAFVEAHRQQGVATALKHYPGHGSSRQDSHISIVDVTDDWKAEELVPYRELIRDRLADAVMITHLINRNFWSVNNLPATLSGNAISYLRQDLGFDGVVLSDDLQMAAVARDHPLASAIVSALAAGNDIVLVGNVLARQPKVARFAVASIAEAVAAGELDQDRLEQAFCRVIALKKKLARQNGDGE